MKVNSMDGTYLDLDLLTRSKKVLIGKRNDLDAYKDSFTLIEIKEMQNKTIITDHFILTVKKKSS